MPQGNYRPPNDDTPQVLTIPGNPQPPTRKPPPQRYVPRQPVQPWGTTDVQPFTPPGLGRDFFDFSEFFGPSDDYGFGGGGGLFGGLPGFSGGGSSAESSGIFQPDLSGPGAQFRFGDFFAPAPQRSYPGTPWQTDSPYVPTPQVPLPFNPFPQPELRSPPSVTPSERPAEGEAGSALRPVPNQIFEGSSGQQQQEQQQDVNITIGTPGESGGSGVSPVTLGIFAAVGAMAIYLYAERN